jgi:hypothetical protein
VTGAGEDSDEAAAWATVAAPATRTIAAAAVRAICFFMVISYRSAAPGGGSALRHHPGVKTA